MRKNSNEQSGNCETLNLILFFHALYRRWQFLTADGKLHKIWSKIKTSSFIYCFGSSKDTASGRSLVRNMKIKEAESYIEKIIKEARTPITDEAAAIYAADGSSPLRDALVSARNGAPDETSSHLEHTTLSTLEKGVILTKAYQAATLKGWRTNILSSPSEQKIFERKAQQANRIAQKLIRAIVILRN